MSKLSILVVEDDLLARKVMEDHLGGHRVDFAPDAATGRRKLEDGRHDICFIDLNLGDRKPASGLKLIPLAAAKGVYPVVMSSQDSETMVEKAYALGCRDFYAKGNERDNVNAVLSRYRTRLMSSADGGVFEGLFLTTDAATRAAVAEAVKYAPSDIPILILGPSGTGKTSLARVFHDQSHRPGPFVAINCSAYTDDLLEAELFGYRKGAFTGAAEDHKGRLLEAHEGTLFLDEIGAMSLKMQTKLLKAVEERVFYPLGADKPERSDFRIVSATLEDLQYLIKVGKLRFDFFQRIHGVTLHLKPLAERKSDIFPLIAHFTRDRRRLSFTKDAKKLMLAHSWPGNVRELKKLVDLLVAGHDGPVSVEALKRLFGTMLAEDGADFAGEEQYRFALRDGLNAAVDRFIDSIIRRSMEENGGTKAQTLRDLRISTRILYASLRRTARHGRRRKS